MESNIEKNGGLKILGLTLARGGSKSVPRKNIKPIIGVPLIAYTIAEALRSQWLTRYIVSTDDVEIQQVALEYGAESPFLKKSVLTLLVRLRPCSMP